MTTVILERPPVDAAAAIPEPQPAAAEPASVSEPDPLPLVGELRLNLSALGIDHLAPDFGERFCRMTCDNELWQFEISAEGELIIMPMTGSEGSGDEGEIIIVLGNWRLDYGGYSYPSTAGFRLPSGAIQAPDAAWINQERYDNLTPSERRGTINGAPDFVVEIRSRSDRLPPFLAKMAEWMAAGAQLGWGIDPYNRRAYIYRAGQDEPETLDDPETLSGEDVLPGFIFAVRRLIFDRHAAAEE